MNYADMIIQSVTALVGTLGFGFLFNIRGKKLVFAAVGGMLAWMLFLVLEPVAESEPLRYLIVSACSTTYAEVLARILKTPATTFSIITLIPLVPGGALYQTTTAALDRNTEVFVPKLIYTIELAVALSLGIVIVTAIFRRFVHKKV
ncbi:MAG: threonine/serine exporter family protein [Clostridia bacterium]|nr:threonine/serine exporter family protein [Clostridia bacterium]